MHCYVTLSNVFQLMDMKTFIHYLTRNLMAGYKVYLCFYCNVRVNPALYSCLLFVGMKFMWIALGFLSVIIYEVLYTWCLRYNISSACFLDMYVLCNEGCTSDIWKCTARQLTIIA